MKNKRYMKNSVLAALLVCATALMLTASCSSFQRVKDPVTGEVAPSNAEQVVKGVVAANAATAAFNPYSPLVAIIGQVAGAFLAGYGGAHVRIRREAPIDGSVAGLALAQALSSPNAPVKN